MPLALKLFTCLFCLWRKRDVTLFFSRTIEMLGCTAPDVMWPLSWWIMQFGLSFSNACMRPEFMTSVSCNSIYCMCGAAWSSRWLMMQLTNAQHACVLVFVPEADIWNIFVTTNLFSPYLMNFMFHTMLDAAGDVLRTHYKSMECDVSFWHCSTSTIFRWGGHFFIHV